MNDTLKNYSKDFYDYNEQEALSTSRHLVPWIIEHLNIKSVIDVGCGTGVWASTFKDFKVPIVKGLDAPSVPKSSLKIPVEDMIYWDLSKKPKLEQQFDLVVSLEVGEHLLPEHADSFVETLSSLGDRILFSAAIPNQGGTHHVNEQWPNYWEKKFEAKGFVAVDCIRPFLWGNNDCAFYYAQNTILYIRSNNNTELTKLSNEPSFAMQNMVHPGQLQAASNRNTPSKMCLSASLKLLVNIASQIPIQCVHAVARRLGLNK